MVAMGAGRTATYRRIAACAERGLLERLELLRGEPSLLRATPEGLRYAGLGLPTTPVSAGQVDHRLRCASAAQLLAEEFDPDAVLTEREIRLHERLEGRPIASARLTDKRLHRPDLAVVTEDRTIAIEVELAPKGPKRLEPIIEAWKRASWVTEVRYFVHGGTTRRGVERAISKLGASERIHLYEAPPSRPPTRIP